MGKEQRQFERTDCPFEIHYRIVGEQLESWRAALSLDLSAKGARFKTEDFIELDMELLVRLVLPANRGDLIVKGQVVWSRSGGPRSTEVGIAFIDVTADQVAQLDELVQFLRLRPH
ncbi:MAG: PilZ domain-containing protein [Candidatus Omnitrophica bacterium]|nr:PilZ domain-containing protein [Candidatus Omnitrophota bacterium]